MRILITGVAGFIGSHLADEIVAAGHRVYGVDNLETGFLKNVPEDVELTVGDIAGYPRGELFSHKTFDLVIHCAASYSDPNKWHRDVKTNTLGTINATLAAMANDCRLIYFQTALPPISSYAISKIAGEQYIVQSGVKHVIFRLANIYGPRNLSGPIPTFFKRLSAGQECTIVKTKRDMVFIDDLVRGVLRVIEQPAINGKFDMCSGHHVSIKDLYGAVSVAMGQYLDVEEIYPAEDDVDKMALDPAPAALTFDWTATTDLESGVDDAVTWYRDNGVAETYTHLKLKG